MGSKEGTWFMPPQASTVAADIDALYYYITYVCIFFFVLVVGLTAYFAVKYRRRPGGPPVKQFTHNLPLELTWSIVPVFILATFFVWGFHSYMNAFVAPRDAMEIRVTGKRWLWDFQYPNGAIQTGELHVPVNKPVKITMTSIDVLHSFFVPEFRVKMDAVPGRYTSLWFEATDVGEYQVFCTEYCGDQHSQMWAKVHVHTQEEYEKILYDLENEGQDLPPAEFGEILYTKKACNTCHSLDGSKLTGPTFKGLYGSEEKLADGSAVKVDDNYLRESILQPQAKVVQGYAPVMPVIGGLKEVHIVGLIEFIKKQK